jgi:hypothetical protein
MFDRLKLKSKVAIDSIRGIQKFAQVLLETAIMNLNKDSGDLNRTIQSVIKYISPMKKMCHQSVTLPITDLSAASKLVSISLTTI